MEDDKKAWQYTPSIPFMPNINKKNGLTKILIIICIYLGIYITCALGILAIGAIIYAAMKEYHIL